MSHMICNKKIGKKLARVWIEIRQFFSIYALRVKLWIKSGRNNKTIMTNNN